jgi:hypothetical protein
MDVMQDESTITGREYRLAEVCDETAARAMLEATLFEIKRVIVGQEELLERVFVALLAGGHLLPVVC